jgi:superfamily II DNA or RNA helicase
MKLRGYQDEVVQAVISELNLGRRKIGIFAGCGSGKTVIAARLCQIFSQHSKRILFCVHLDVLVEQTAKKMMAYGLDCGFIKAGWTEYPDAQVQIASIQTMSKRKWWKHLRFDVIFFDEAHITLFSKIGYELLYSVYPRALFVAMTGTPKRLGKDQLGEHLDSFVSAPTPAKLMEMGYLSPLKYFALGSSDESKFRLDSTGDYQESDLRNACDTPEVINKTVQDWLYLTPQKRTLAFCVDKNHAKNLAAAFNRINVSAAFVDGDTPTSERNAIYSKLRTKEIVVLTSCNVISIGFDEPSVEVGILCRPTKSEALHQQQIGRVMRLSTETGKQFGVILDQAGNLARLGFPEDIWQYEMPYKGQTNPGQRVAPKKACPKCSSLVPCLQMICSCGHQWLKHATIDLDQLVEVYPRERLLTEGGAIVRLLHAYRQNAIALGYPPEWADNQMLTYPGVLPEKQWYRGSFYGIHATPEQKLAALRYLISQGQSKEWIEYQFDLEYGAGTLREYSSAII